MSDVRRHTAADDAWDEMAGVWLEGAPARLWRAHSDAVNARLLDAWLPGPLGQVLKTDLFDEAVSPGLADPLLARAVRVTGIDVNQRIRDAAARRRPEIRAVEADVQELPFADGAFDTIVSNSTLDHFDDTGEIHASLRELARVLAPGGRLLVTLDNPWNPVVGLGKALRGAGLNRAWQRTGASTAKVGLAPYYVGATLGRDELADALSACALEVVRTGTIVHAPRLLAVLAGSALEPRLGDGGERRFLRALEACEGLGRLPTRRVTGHFVAALARRPPERASAERGAPRAEAHDRGTSNAGSTMALP